MDHMKAGGPSMQQYLSLFRNRNFLFHWLAGAISNVGDFFNSLALVKILSEDPDRMGLYMALIMIAKVVPGVLLGPVAGVVADRLPRKAIMIITDLLRAVLVLGLVVVEQPAAIMALIFLSAMVSVFYQPASSALLPNLVEKDELVSAGSLSVMTQRMAMLLGNGIGAAVLVHVGPHNVFYIDAASFVLSALFVALMAVPAVAKVAEAKPSAERQSTWQKFKDDVKEALAFLRGAETVRNLMSTLGIVAVGDAGLNVLLVTFFTVGLGVAAESLGYIWALFGGASVVGALAMGAIGKKIAWRHLVSVGGVYVWLTTMGALVTDSLAPSVTFMTLMGLGSGAINVGIQAAIGELVPDHVRGRVFSAWSMINNLIYVVGALSAGALSDWLGPTPVLMGFTTFFLLGSLYAFFAFRPRTSPATTAPVAAGE